MSFGVEHQLNNVMAVSGRYIHKQLDRGIEDIGDLGPAGEAYIIGNPGEGRRRSSTSRRHEPDCAPGATNLTQTLPKPKREYSAGEVAIEKRLSHSWFAKATYTLSRDAGNYPGLSESDENGRSDPNVGRSYDYPAELFTGAGQPELRGVQTDRTHQLKVDAIYTFKFDDTGGPPIHRQRHAGQPAGRHHSRRQLPDLLQRPRQ